MLGCHFIEKLIIFVSKLAADINKISEKKLSETSYLSIVAGRYSFQGSMLANSSHYFLHGSLIVIICL